MAWLVPPYLLRSPEVRAADSSAAPSSLVVCDGWQQNEKKQVPASILGTLGHSGAVPVSKLREIRHLLQDESLRKRRLSGGGTTQMGGQLAGYNGGGNLNANASGL